MDGPEIRFHRFEGFSLREKHDWFRSGPGAGALRAADLALREIGRRMAASDAVLRAAFREIGSEWPAPVAGVLASALSGDPAWARDLADAGAGVGSGDASGASRARLRDLADRFDEVTGGVEPVETAACLLGENGAAGLRGFAAVASGRTDLGEAARRNRARDSAANLALQTYENAVRSDLKAIPSAPAAPPLVVVAVPDDQSHDLGDQGATPDRGDCPVRRSAALREVIQPPEEDDAPSRPGLPDRRVVRHRDQADRGAIPTPTPVSGGGRRGAAPGEPGPGEPAPAVTPTTSGRPRRVARP
ncbi:hypothetical protein [Streptoalloteichus hindustanus]|uniref:Uncharacterized protein n=1 Tax=Streptoalloteichus hindustanus TaxID=2017 RepID=A0A1M5QAV7_STRHI|nr:hypothetical protein [Streptoalloteichus hindustanus]SHH11225.1 hypothetical protein SAMN05444320_1234 [Streptoalloteichus hindustanus]